MGRTSRREIHQHADHSALQTLELLPEPQRPFTSKELDIVEEVLSHAQRFAIVENGIDNLTLSRVLKSYSVILPKYGYSPSEDTIFYRFLVKLSVGAEGNWVRRFAAEKRKNKDFRVSFRTWSRRAMKSAFSTWRDVARFSPSPRRRRGEFGNESLLDALGIQGSRRTGRSQASVSPSFTHSRRDHTASSIVHSEDSVLSLDILADLSNVTDGRGVQVWTKSRNTGAGTSRRHAGSPGSQASPSMEDISHRLQNTRSQLDSMRFSASPGGNSDSSESCPDLNLEPEEPFGSKSLSTFADAVADFAGVKTAAAVRNSRRSPERSLAFPSPQTSFRSRATDLDRDTESMIRGDNLSLVDAQAYDEFRLMARHYRSWAGEVGRRKEYWRDREQTARKMVKARGHHEVALVRRVFSGLQKNVKLAKYEAWVDGAYRRIYNWRALVNLGKSAPPLTSPVQAFSLLAWVRHSLPLKIVPLYKVKKVAKRLGEVANRSEEDDFTGKYLVKGVFCPKHRMPLLIEGMELNDQYLLHGILKTWRRWTDGVLIFGERSIRSDLRLRLAHWRRETKVCAAANLLLGKTIRAKARSFLIHWEQMAAYEATLRTAGSRISRRCSAREGKEALQAWRLMTQMINMRNSVIDSLRGRGSRRSTADAIGVWRGFQAARVNRRESVGKAMRYWKGSSRSLAFGHWRSIARMTRSLRLGLMSVSNGSKKLQKRLSFMSWANRSAVSSQRRTSSLLCFERSSELQKLSAYHFWRSYATEKRDAWQKLFRATSYDQQTARRRSFTFLQQFTQQRVLEKAKKANADNLHTRLMSKSFLKEWKETTRLNIHRRSTFTNADAHRWLVVTLTSFATFRRNALDEKNRMMEIEDAICNMVQTNHMQTHLDLWRNMALLHRAEKQVQQCTRAHRIRRGLQALVLESQEKLWERSKMKDVGRIVVHGNTYRAFTEWKAVVELYVWYRECIEMQLGRWLRRTRTGALEKWRSRVKRTKRREDLLRRAVKKVALFKEAKAIEKWIAVKINGDKLILAANLWRTKGSMQPFKKWQAHLEHKRGLMSRHDEVVLRRCASLSRASLTRWMTAFRYESAASKVRMCNASYLTRWFFDLWFKVWSARASMRAVFETRDCVREQAFLQQAYERWSGWAKSLGQLHLAEYKTFHLIVTSLRRRYLRSWAVIAKRHHRCRVLVARGVRRMQSRVYVHVFPCWRGYISFLRHRRGALEGIFTSHCNDLVEHGWRKWMEFMDECERERQVIASCCERMNSQPTVRAFNSWLDYTQWRQYNRSVVANHIHTMKHYLHLKAIRKWCAYTALSSPVTSSATRLLKIWYAFRRARAFRTWKGVMQTTELYMCRGRKVLAFWRAPAVAWAWYRMSLGVRHLRELRKKFKTSSLHYLRRAGKPALDRMRSRVAWRHLINDVVMRMKGIQSFVLMREAIVQWRLILSRRSLVVGALVASSSNLDRVRTADAFAHWAYVNNIFKLIHMSHAEKLTRWFGNQRKVVFCFWKREVRIQKDARIICEKMDRNHMRRHFLALCEHMDLMCRVESMRNSVVGKMMLRWVRLCFDALKLYSDKQNKVYLSYVKARAMKRKKMAEQYFKRWNNRFVVYQVLDAYGTGMKGLARKNLLLKVFVGWKRFVNIRKEDLRAIMYKCMPKHMSLFYKWRAEATWVRRRRTEAEAAHHHMHQLIRRNVFSRWYAAFFLQRGARYKLQSPDLNALENAMRIWKLPLRHRRERQDIFNLVKNKIARRSVLQHVGGRAVDMWRRRKFWSAFRQWRDRLVFSKSLKRVYSAMWKRKAAVYKKAGLSWWKVGIRRHQQEARSTEHGYCAAQKRTWKAWVHFVCRGQHRWVLQHRASLFGSFSSVPAWFEDSSYSPFESKAIAEKCSDILQERNRRVVGKAFIRLNTLRLYAHQKKAVSFAHSLMGGLRRGFACWCKEMEYTRAIAAVGDGLASKSSAALRKRTFQAWCLRHRQKKVLKKAVGLISGRCFSFKLRIIMLRWHEHVVTDRYLRSTLLSFKASKVVKPSFVAWVEWTKGNMMLADFSESLVTVSSKMLLADAREMFNKWRVITAFVKEISDRITNATGLRRRQYRRDAFLRWKGVADCLQWMRRMFMRLSFGSQVSHKTRRNTAEDIIRKRWMSQKHNAFFHWVHRVLLSRSMQQALYLANSHSAKALRAMSFRLWHRRTKEFISDYNKKKQARRFMFEMLTGRSIRKWIELVDHAHTMRTIIHMIMRNQCLKAINRWQDAVEMRVAARAQIAKAMSSWGNAAIRRAIFQWGNFSIKSRQDRRRVLISLTSKGRRSMTKAWNKWVEVKLDMEEWREKFSRIYLHWKKRKLSKCWQSWMYHMEICDRAHMVAVRVLNAHLMAALRTWKDLAKDNMERKQKFFLVAFKHDRVVLEKYFDAWSETASRDARLKRCASIIRDQSESAVMRAGVLEWCANVQRTIRLRTTLAVCSERLRSKSMTISFLHWRIVATSIAWNRNVNSRAHLHFFGKNTRWALATWAKNVRRIRGMRAIASHFTPARGFAAFKTYCRLRKAARVICGERTQLTFAHWSDVTDLLMRQREAFKLAKVYNRMKLLTTGLRGWEEGAIRSREEYEMQVVAYKKMCSYWLTRWLNTMEWKKKMHLKYMKVVIARHRIIREHSLKQWMKAYTAVHYDGMKTKACHFSAWLGHTVRRVDLREKLCHHLLMRRGQALKESFVFWHCFMLHEQLYRQKLRKEYEIQGQVERALLRARMEKARHCLVEWSRFARKRAAKFRHNWVSVMKRRAFLRWQVMVYNRFKFYYRNMNNM